MKWGSEIWFVAQTYTTGSSATTEVGYTNQRAMIEIGFSTIHRWCKTKTKIEIERQEALSRTAHGNVGMLMPLLSARSPASGALLLVDCDSRT